MVLIVRILTRRHCTFSIRNKLKANIVFLYKFEERIFQNQATTILVTSSKQDRPNFG